MKTKMTYLFVGLILICLTAYNLMKISEYDSSNLSLSDLNFRIANAIQEQGEDKCDERTGVQSSQYGFIFDVGSPCTDEEGVECGRAYSCKEDKSLPKLPNNQSINCEVIKCKES